ncbi:MAG TPA: cyclopropane-fatty-acyl-phospholipid synthase family protein [Alphaproteobacteria bacterium]|nr:cyclopropane-fatty-acyl-phospholipid synthase family protein [Alphaproteobacteria bacterium]
MTTERETATRRAPASALMRAFLSLAGAIACGRLSIETPGGEIHRIAAPSPGPEADLVIHDERALRRLFAGGKLAFAEAYMDGDWSSENLAGLIELGARNEHILAPAWSVRTAVVAWHALLNRARHLIANRNSRSGSKRNIASHYDLGNGFYRQWLDPTMTYSSAIFDGTEQPLQDAQIAKWRRIADMADLRPGQRVLEIGCGWGGFARFAARERGCEVVGLTLSQAQREWALAEIAREGLQDRIDIRLQDYRDVAGSFDRIVSIEMFEAVGEAYWPAFYDTLRARLAPGGIAALQIITIADADYAEYRESVDFIQRYIFPGGMLPSPTILSGLAARAGLREIGHHAFGLDYARTLEIWRERFDAAWGAIAPLGFDARFRRMWRYYLAYCEGGFRAGTIDVRQLALQKP